MKKVKLVFAILSSFILAQFILTSKAQIPIYINEAESYLLAKSYLTENASINNVANKFSYDNGYAPFPVPIYFLIPFTLLGNTFYLLKIPHLTAGFLLLISMFFLIKEVSEKTDQKLFSFLIAFLIVLSAWVQSLILFHIPDTLALTFFSISILSLIKIKKNPDDIKHWIILGVFGLLTSLCSWPGLIISLVYPLITFIYLKRFKRKHLLYFTIIFYLFTAVNIYKNLNYIKTFFLDKTFINQITPQKLAEEINERQKIDFLSSNRQFILPTYLRKFIYNKPFLAFEKTFKKTVSFIDFEQYAFPLISYDIIRFSGFLPKGNLPLGYFWEIPLLLLGIYLLLIRNEGMNRSIFLLIPFILLPPLFFEKRDLLTSGILIIPFLLALEIFAFKKLINTTKYIPKKVLTLILCFVVFLIISGVYEQYKLIYTDKFSYQTSDLFFYKEISTFVLENEDKFDKIVVTNRFGPTGLMTTFYLNLPVSEYWKSPVSENNDLSKIENLEFRKINFPAEDVKANTLYIGLPGEFTKPGENPNNIQLPSYLTLIGEIVAPDELVYHFGENIWIVTENIKQ